MTSRFAAALFVALVSLAPDLVRADAPAPTANVADLLRNAKALHSWMERSSHEVVAARAELAAARAGARGARLLPNPTADFSVANLPVSNTHYPTHGLDRMLIFGVGLSETFELGKRGPRGEAADLHAAAAEHRIVATLADSVNEARDALARAVYAQVRAQTLDEALRTGQAEADIAKGRLDHQALSGVDYDRLLIDLASLQADVARAHAEQAAALERCSAALLARCDLGVAGVADIDVAAVVPDAVTGHEVESRADLAALQKDRDAFGKEAQLASRRAIPDLTFRLGYTRDNFTVSGDNLNTLALSVALPLPVFDRGQHDQSRALAQADQLEAMARATLTRARGQLAELVDRKSAVEAALKAVEGDVLPRAERVLVSQEKGLEEGQLDMTDLLLARRQAVTLRMQALDLRFELFDIKNDIRRTLGLDGALAHR